MVLVFVIKSSSHRSLGRVRQMLCHTTKFGDGAIGSTSASGAENLGSSPSPRAKFPDPKIIRLRSREPFLSLTMTLMLVRSNPAA